MELFHMMFPERGFEQVAVGVQVAVDGDRSVWAESTGAGDFKKAIYDVKIRPSEGFAKGHVFFRMFF